MWFIATMNAVFEQGGSLVRREVAHNLMRLIAEGMSWYSGAEESQVGLPTPAVGDTVVLHNCSIVCERLVKPT